MSCASESCTCAEINNNKTQFTLHQHETIVGRKGKKTSNIDLLDD